MRVGFVKTGETEVGRTTTVTGLVRTAGFAPERVYRPVTGTGGGTFKLRAGFAPTETYVERGTGGRYVRPVGFGR